jgi:predicted permease
MTTLRQACLRLVAFFRKPELDREFDEELAAHVEPATQDHLRRGMSLPEARRLAPIKLRGIEPSREVHRESRGLPWLDGIVQDGRYAVRAWHRSPGFTAVAVLSLALGIGANTAIFSLMESAVWKPISVKNPEQLRLLTWRGLDRYGMNILVNFRSLDRPAADGGMSHPSFTYPIYQELQWGNTVFESLFGFQEIGRITAVVDGAAEPVNCLLVSGGFYQGMQVSPVIGRPIGPENDVRTADSAVAVISYAYWTRRFSRNPSVIGKTITLNQVPVTIIGVNPEYFTGIDPGANFEIWAPLSLQPAALNRDGSLLDAAKVWWLPVMGRLKPGISDAQAQSALDVIFQHQIDAYFPGMKTAEHPRLIVEPGVRGMDYLAYQYRHPLLVLLALAGLVLLIACANVANLLLAKSAVRQREISLRLALGAAPWRIVRQLLTEGLMLASLAGVAGVILGYWTRNSIPVLLATSWRPSPFEAAFDPKVLLISIGITFLTGTLFSLAPAWQARRVEVNGALNDGSRGTPSLSKLRAGRLLVVLQVTLSLILLVGTGLFVQTFTNLKSTPIGFNPDRVLLFVLDPPRLGYASDRAATLFAGLQERIEAIPGVQSATFSSSPLLSGGGAAGTRLTTTGGKPDSTQSSSARYNDVGSHFFQTMGIPILYGRAVDARDGAGTPSAVVVNREFARHFFHRDNPVGGTFTDLGGITHAIVGVCADALYNNLRDPVKPTFYKYLIQTPRNGITFEVKIAGEKAGVLKHIRQFLNSIDSDLAITDVRTQTEQIEDTLSQERLLASLAVAFGGLALILACIGIYGVMAYTVARRTSEIGIRVALGANPTRVAWMVLRETMSLAAVGIAIGIPGVLSVAPILNHSLAARYTDNFLHGLKPNDPHTIVAAVLTLAVVGGLAGYLPALRAAHVDPMTALRHD